MTPRYLFKSDFEVFSTRTIFALSNQGWGLKLPKGDGFRNPMIVDEDLQRAFRAAHSLHPNREIAFEVTRDGIRRGEMKLADQNRRPPSIRPNKQKLSLRNVLLAGVFAASDIWERDQESRQPIRIPQYRPTQQDFIGRYVKTLVWHSMDRNSEWVSIAIGHFVYGYPINQIARVSPEFFDHQNMWRTRTFLADVLNSRFQWSSPRSGSSAVPTLERPATAKEIEHIDNLLKALAPVIDNHPAGCSNNQSILEEYLFPQSTRTEPERIHALINSECGGWSRLVREYNDSQTMFPDEHLAEPREQLRIPMCAYTRWNSPSARTMTEIDDNRFQPEPLTGIELNSLRRSSKATDFIIDEYGETQ